MVKPPCTTSDMAVHLACSAVPVRYCQDKGLPQITIALAQCERRSAHMQGEAGIVIPDPGYLSGAQALLKKHNALLICDEVRARACWLSALCLRAILMTMSARRGSGRAPVVLLVRCKCWAALFPAQAVSQAALGILMPLKLQGQALWFFCSDLASMLTRPIIGPEHAVVAHQMQTGLAHRNACWRTSSPVQCE